MLGNMMSQGRQAFIEWRQKKTLRDMLNDPRSAKGCRSIGQLEKGIAAIAQRRSAWLLDHRCEKDERTHPNNGHWLRPDRMTPV